MCFAPQRRALFRHRNFQKWSEPGVFCTFWLRNVLRATTACTFSTSQLPKVVRTWCVLYILTSKCASRHNGVHFFIISTSKSGPSEVLLPQMCFAPQRLFQWSEPGVFCTFLRRPLEPQIIGKTHSVSRLSYLFAHLHLLSSDSFSSLIFSLLLFSLLLFSSLWLFPSLLFICPYCQKFDFETSFDYIWVTPHLLFQHILMFMFKHVKNTGLKSADQPACSAPGIRAP